MVSAIALAAVVAALITVEAVHPATADATLTLDTSTLTASWKESWLTGNVAFAGTVGEPSELTIILRRVDPKPTAVAAKRTLTVASGGYSGKLDLPHRALPGSYLLRVVGTSSGIALTPVEATLTLPAPPEGIVDKASIGLTPGGKAVRKVNGSVKQLHARFHFLVAPKLRTAVRLVWRTPQFNFVGEVRKPYSTNISTFVKSGQPLPKGTWYCLLTVNEIVVKRVSVRVT